MPSVQDIYTERPTNCIKCGDPIGGHGSELPGRRYLCQSCSDLKRDLERLVGTPEGIEQAKAWVEMLEGMAQNPVFGETRDDRSEYFQDIYDDLYQSIVNLQVLIREAETEQPWD